VTNTNLDPSNNIVSQKVVTTVIKHEINITSRNLIRCRSVFIPEDIAVQAIKKILET